MTVGIYSLYWEEQDLIYIGLSSNIERRFAEHKRDAQNNEHTNYKVQNAFNSFGIPILYVLEKCTISELNKLEIQWMKEFDALGTQGLCIVEGGQAGFGEYSPNSKYSNEQIEQVFKLLVDYPEKSFKEIEGSTSVSMSIIKDISCGRVHLWLREKFPEKYSILESLIGVSGEKHGNSKYSNKQIEQVFNLLVDPLEISIKEISDITLVPITTVRDISSSKAHLWLKEKYPEKYIILESLKGSRYRPKTSKDMGIIHPKIKSPEGLVYQIDNTNKFAKEHGLHQGHLGAVLKGQAKQHKGWKLA